MAYSRWLLRTELIAACVLFVVALVFALYAAIADRSVMVLWLFPFTFVATIAIGGVPMLLCGAPVYALLAHRNKATWWRALIIGVVPGLFISFISPRYGMLFIVFGPIVAIGTHLGNRFGLLKGGQNERPAL